MNRSVIKFGICLTLLAFMASTAMAAQTVHYYQNFTDGTLVNAGPEVGSLAEGNPAVSLQTQEAWRNAAQTYYGWAKATAFDGAVGFATGFTSTALTLANTPILNAGNVWVLDASMISDVATTGGQFYNNAPGVIIEPHPFSGVSGLVAKLSPAVSSAGPAEGMILQNEYPFGADNTVQPTTLGTSLAGVGTSLDGVLRAKYVWMGITGNTQTRLSSEVLTGNTPMGTASRLENAAFRTDYNTGTGLMFQFIKGHPGTNVSYATGVPDASTGGADKTDVPYVEAATNLQMGFTEVTFKQVAQSDSNTDGVVNGAGDVPIWTANFGGTGKSFFQGDSSGDGTVNGAGDVPIWVSQFGSDVMGPGGILVEYTPSTGATKVSMNNIGSLRLISDDGLIIPGSAPTNAGVPGSVFHDPATINETNYGGFPLNTQDDLSLGVFLPTGLATINEQFVAASKFRVLYTVFGGTTTNIPLSVVNTEFVIPEPCTLGLAGLAGVAMLRVTRRRRKLV